MFMMLSGLFDSDNFIVNLISFYLLVRRMVHPQSVKQVKLTSNCLFSLLLDVIAVSAVVSVNHKADFDFEAKMLKLMGKHSFNFFCHQLTA